MIVNVCDSIDDHLRSHWWRQVASGRIRSPGPRADSKLTLHCRDHWWPANLNGWNGNFNRG